MSEVLTTTAYKASLCMPLTQTAEQKQEIKKRGSSKNYIMQKGTTIF